MIKKLYRRIRALMMKKKPVGYLITLASTSYFNGITWGIDDDVDEDAFKVAYELLFPFHDFKIHLFYCK